MPKETLEERYREMLQSGNNRMAIGKYVTFEKEVQFIKEEIEKALDSVVKEHSNFSHLTSSLEATIIYIKDNL